MCSGNNQRMFAAQATKLFDVTFGGPILVKDSQTSGNYAAAQLANQGGDFLIAVNEAGDYPLRFNGSTWETLDGGEIHGPVDSGVEDGHGLSYVWKYRSRLYFIEVGSMNAWYLPLNAVEGALLMIPLSGAATKGGHLMFGATWSLDAGDGVDDKCVFCTSEGELLIFTGSDPGNPANWRQEGRFEISPPLGMNAHHLVGGDLLIATVDGIIPTSAAITKEGAQLELAAVTRPIKPMWRAEVVEKREHPWTMKKWDEYGGMFVTWPFGKPGKKLCAVINLATGAWARFVGWDATCFMRLRENFYFGTQDGIVMQADRTGYDDGNHAKIPYVATLVGSWECAARSPVNDGMATGAGVVRVGRQRAVQAAALSNGRFCHHHSAATARRRRSWSTRGLGPGTVGRKPSGTSRQSAPQRFATRCGCRSARPATLTRLSSR